MKKTTWVTFFILICNTLSGQFQPLNEQYMLDGLSINPAYAGTREALSLTISYRNQWIGFEGAPTTETLSLHSPLMDNKIGVGLYLMNNEIGITNETGMMGNYSYKMKTGKGQLSLGLGTGFSMRNKDSDDIRFYDQGDEVLMDSRKLFVIPNFSVGIYYYTKKYYAGVSMPFFMTYHYHSTSSKFKIHHSFGDCNYIFTGGYLWKINEEISILPNALFKINPSDDKQLDLNIHVILRDKFWVGTNYRTKNGLIWMFQFQINNQLRAAYSYGIDFSELGKQQNGTHEIMLRYDFKYLLEVVSPRYF